MYKKVIEMISIEDNIKLKYPKIDTLFNRKEDFSLKLDEYRKPEYGNIKLWEVTEKIDGTNIRIMWKDKEITIGGRTERADIPSEVTKYVIDHIKPGTMDELFGDKTVVLYGEGYGGKIQKMKGYGSESKFILFDVFVNGYWLKREDIEDIAKSLEIDIVPFLGLMTVEEIIELVRQGFESKIGQVYPCEGIIAKTNPILFDNKNDRLIFKLKHSDFLK